MAIRSGGRPSGDEDIVLSLPKGKGRKPEGVAPLSNRTTIDKAKGIVAKPMPKEWHDWFAINNMDADPVTKQFYKSIVADKKPYFMCYVYPSLMKEYKGYIKSVSRISKQKFNKSIEEINQTPLEQLSEDEVDYARFVKIRMPVGDGDCVMNKICRRFEAEFDKSIKRDQTKTEFDYSIMKSGSTQQYNRTRYSAVKKLYLEFSNTIQKQVVTHAKRKNDSEEWRTHVKSAREQFMVSCDSVCNNEIELTDMLMDVCYSKNCSKDLIWSSRGHQIINNLLERNNGQISVPVKDDSGDIVFCGNKFKIITKEVEII